MDIQQRTRTLSTWLSRHARPLEGGTKDFDALLDLIGEAPIVMLGEASHGTAEFYATRSRITQRLIAEKGFDIVAIEGDWPDSARANTFVLGHDGSAFEAMEGFRRFPTWMWRNNIVLDFVDWLRRWNDQFPEHVPKVGFYGLDVYSLHASIAQVVRFLDLVDREAAHTARLRYACFEPFGDDSQKYALGVYHLAQSCEEAVVRTLLDLQARRQVYARKAGIAAQIDAEMNALAAVHAEEYYRRLPFNGRVTWNLRDRHMEMVLDRLLEYRGPRSKAVIWAHNSHVGDFRATGEAHAGYINLGGLVRKRYPGKSVAVGFGTYQGTVTAASRWDGEPEFKRIPPARAGSTDALFHASGIDRFYLPLAGLDPADVPGEILFRPLPERAIGVVYHPEHEVRGNYVQAILGKRYDAFFYFDRTLAVEPLDFLTPQGLETYPSGF